MLCLQWLDFKNALQALEDWDKLYKQNRYTTTDFNLVSAGWNPCPLCRAITFTWSCQAYWAQSTIFYNFKLSDLVNTWTSGVGTHIGFVSCLPLVTKKESHLLKVGWVFVCLFFQFIDLCVLKFFSGGIRCLHTYTLLYNMRKFLVDSSSKCSHRAWQGEPVQDVFIMWLEEWAPHYPIAMWFALEFWGFGCQECCYITHFYK